MEPYQLDDQLYPMLKQQNQSKTDKDANKSHFAVSEIEYLGYWIMRNVIQPVDKKVKAIQCIAPLTTKKQVQSFIGLINYYRDMWPRRSEILAPLTHLTSKDVPFQWTDVEQQAFDKIKAIVTLSQSTSFIPRVTLINLFTSILMPTIIN
jgi:putative transposase